MGFYLKQPTGRKKFLLLMLSLFACISLGTGCGSEKSKKANAMNQAEGLLDRKEYTQAIDYITDVLRDFPSDPDLESLLANAYMGRGGIELLSLVGSILGPQDSRPLGIYQEPVCGTEAVKDLSNLSFSCFLYRLVKHLPEVDNPDFLKAQQIYRTIFPNPASTSTQVNFSAGILEAILAVTRVKTLLKNELVLQMSLAVTTDMRLFPYDTVIRHVKHGIDEINWSIARFHYSYDSLNNFVKSINGTTVLTIGSRSLTLDSTIQYSTILKFFARVLQDESIILDQQMSVTATDKLHSMSGGISKFLCSTNPDCISRTSTTDSKSNVLASNSLGTYLAESYMSSFMISLLAASDSNVNISLFELAWKEPPPLIQSLLKAGLDAWNSESGAPILAYLNSTQVQWKQLRDLSVDWNSWLNESMTFDEQVAFFDQVSMDASNSQSLLAVPKPNGSSPLDMKKWVVAVLSLGNFEANQLITRNSRSGVALVPPQVIELQNLLGRTNTWMNSNFYPVSDWATLN